jgi:hypothetical protein
MNGVQLSVVYRARNRANLMSSSQFEVGVDRACAVAS